jgi:hypothetical protein
MIIGFSGKKQSGKTTSGNFIASVFLANLGICDSVRLNDIGEIEVSDLLGEKNYAGVFDPNKSPGTDYIIQQVTDKLSPQIKLYSFADVLKQDICIDILGLTYQQCYGSDEDKNSLTNIVSDNGRMTARDVMQYIGTDVFRKIKPNIWVDATLNKIRKDNPKIAVITDCRFPNEVEAIKKNNGVVVRLTRAPFESDHISENILNSENYEWNNFNYVLDNNNMSIYDQCVELEKILIEVLSL